MIIWQAHGARLRSTTGLGAKDSLVFECHDPKEYDTLATFPRDVEKGVTLHEPNRFFLPFNAAMHLVNVSPLRENLSSHFKKESYQRILNYHFQADPHKTLNILFSAPMENAHAHGNKFNPKKKIVVEYEFKPVNNHLLLALQFTDEGAGFDWKHLLEAYRQATKSYHHELSNPNPHLRHHFPHAQGLALYSLLDMCDKVEFNEKGNRITLVKHLMRNPPQQ